MIDFTTEFGRRVRQRLDEEYFIWFTTVGTDLTPQPRPVWFSEDAIRENLERRYRPGAPLPQRAR